MTITFSVKEGEYAWHRGTLYELGAGRDEVLGIPANKLERCGEREAYCAARKRESKKVRM